MKKFIIRLFVVVMPFILVKSAAAVLPGKFIEYGGKGQGRVIFDGKLHYDQGLKCPDCHEGIFKKKKGENPMSAADMNAGKGCGVCHNGVKAFGTKDQASCGKCHKK